MENSRWQTEDGRFLVDDLLTGRLPSYSLDMGHSTLDILVIPATLEHEVVG